MRSCWCQFRGYDALRWLWMCFEIVSNHIHRRLPNQVDLLVRACVRRRQQDVVTALAVCRTCAWVDGDGVGFFHAQIVHAHRDLQSRFERGLCFLVAYQFNAPEQAPATDIPNVWMLT